MWRFALGGVGGLGVEVEGLGLVRRISSVTVIESLAVVKMYRVISERFMFYRDTGGGASRWFMRLQTRPKGRMLEETYRHSVVLGPSIQE